jgi:hypothetical protein
LRRRALAAAKEILTYTTCTSVKIFSINEGYAKWHTRRFLISFRKLAHDSQTSLNLIYSEDKITES